MLLRELRLTNVGVFEGVQRLEFSHQRDRAVTLVGGKNGAGKTTLLNAIPLALYGNRAKSLVGASAYPEYLNGLVHRGCRKASIALIFDRREAGKTTRYTVEREWAKTASGKAADRLYVTVNDVPRPDLEANWADFVEGVMPLSVSGLAVFDGEKIEALADVGNSADVIRTALYGLLGLDLVDRLQRDLGDYRRRTARQTLPTPNDLGERLKQAEDQLGMTLAESEVAQGDVLAAERALELATSEQRAAAERLADSGGDLFFMRERLHQEMVEAVSAALVGARRLEALVAGDLPLLLVRPLLQHVVGAGERSQLATDATLLLQRMKERDERLLHTAGSRRSGFPPEALDALTALLEADRGVYEVTHHVTYEVTPDAASAARDLLGLVGDELAGEVSQVLADLASATVTSELARRSLGSVPSGDAIQEVVRSVADADSRVRVAETALAGARERLGEIERRVVAAQREVDRLATEVLEAGASDSDAVRIAREVDRAESTLGRFASRIVARHVDRITDNISVALTSLLRKEGLVTKIWIDPSSLHISLFGRDASLIDPGRLSAGERQMLATAVLWGLSKSTGRTLPTVIDTPVGRLDKSHRSNLVTRYFPFAARQVVLLSTDEEITGRYLSQLRPFVGREYLLKYDDRADATTITNGYFR
jgi:DNA sulfur modification protein DndD